MQIKNSKKSGVKQSAISQKGTIYIYYVSGNGPIFMYIYIMYPEIGPLVSDPGKYTVKGR